MYQGGSRAKSTLLLEVAGCVLEMEGKNIPVSMHKYTMLEGLESREVVQTIIEEGQQRTHEVKRVTGEARGVSGPVPGWTFYKRQQNRMRVFLLAARHH